MNRGVNSKSETDDLPATPMCLSVLPADVHARNVMCVDCATQIPLSIVSPHLRFPVVVSCSNKSTASQASSCLGRDWQGPIRTLYKHLPAAPSHHAFSIISTTSLPTSRSLHHRLPPPHPRDTPVLLAIPSPSFDRVLGEELLQPRPHPTT